MISEFQMKKRNIKSTKQAKIFHFSAKIESQITQPCTSPFESKLKLMVMRLQCVSDKINDSPFRWRF